MKANKFKGISLIILVITIIVILILAGSVILSLSQNNPINSASEAKFKTSMDQYQSELTMYISKQYAEGQGTFNPSNLNTTTSAEIMNIITGMTSTEASKFKIESGKLKYIGTSVSEALWCKDLGLTFSLLNSDLILWLEGSDFTNSPQTTSWVDRSGNGYNAVPYTFSYNSASGSDGAGSVVFDGSTDYALVTGSFPQILTIETWAKATVIDGRMMWSFDGINNVSGPDLFPNNTRLNLNIGDGAANPFSNAYFLPSLGVWHHYVIVFDKVNNKGYLYYDGEYKGQATYRDPSGTLLYIGKYDNAGYFWYGSIKSIRVYNRVLTATEIVSNYIASK